MDAFIAKNPVNFNMAESWFQLVIIQKNSGSIIGDIGVHFVGDENSQCELGITLDKNFQGKGYATEALQTVMDYLFYTLNKNRIFASIDPDNINSINLMDRLNFRKEAHFRKSLFIDGKWVDDVIFAILQEEWK